MKKNNKLFLKLLLTSVVIFLTLFVFELGLKLLNFPSSKPEKISHPKNYHEKRVNIEFEYDFNTNNHGLRYKTIPADASERLKKIFVIGDSFTEGVGVRDGQRFADILENNYSSSEESVYFINGGLAGTGPLKYGRLFIEYADIYKPQAVLICLYFNDIANTPAAALPEQLYLRPQNNYTGARKLIRSIFPRIYTSLELMKDSRKYRHETDSANFVRTISEVAKQRHVPDALIDQWEKNIPKELVEAVEKKQFNGNLLSQGLLNPDMISDAIDLASDTAVRKFNAMAEVLLEINRFAKRKGIEVGFVYIPSPYQYDPDRYVENHPVYLAGYTLKKEWLVSVSPVQQKLKNWADKNSLHYLDLTPVMRNKRKEGVKLNWSIDAHWNPEGHKVAAAAISQWLKENKVFACLN